jgi:hypothetical protein
MICVGLPDAAGDHTVRVSAVGPAKGPDGLRRPFRDGIVDGDDVWPQLSTADLKVIAELDRQREQRERTNGRLPERAFKQAGGAIYSVAELVRHYRDLVSDLEQGIAEDYELLTELGCRDNVERLVETMPLGLRAKLQRDLLTPLDQRFEAATIDGGGAFLRSRFGTQVGSGRRWTRRPHYAPDDDAPLA